MSFLITILIVGIIAAFYMGWTIGANDLANAMGPSVGGGGLSVRNAVIIGGILTIPSNDRSYMYWHVITTFGDDIDHQRRGTEDKQRSQRNIPKEHQKLIRSDPTTRLRIPKCNLSIIIRALRRTGRGLFWSKARTIPDHLPGNRYFCTTGKSNKRSPDKNGDPHHV